jgi:hypothetical protein
VRPSLAFNANGQSSGATFVINAKLGAVRITELELGKV